MNDALQLPLSPLPPDEQSRHRQPLGPGIGWAWPCLRLAWGTQQGAWGAFAAVLGLVLELGAYAALVPLAAQAGPILGQPQALFPVACGIVLAYGVKGLGSWLRQSGAQAVGAQAALAARMATLADWPNDVGLEGQAAEEAASLHAKANALRLALGAWLDALPLGLGAIALACAAALATSWRLVLVAVVLALLMACLAKCLALWVAPATRRAIEASQSAQAEATALLLRSPLWRAAQRPELLEQRARNGQEQQALAEAAQARRDALSPALLGFLQAMAIAALALAGAHEAASGRLDLAQLAALGAALALAIDPALGLAAAWSRWQSAQVALRNWSFPEARPKPPKATPAPVSCDRKGQGSLVLRELQVAPPGSKQRGHALSLHMEAQESLLLLGPNGAGKSSLLKALAGVWPPLAGTAELDGKALVDWPTGEVAWAAQEALLIGPTLEDDLRLFAPDAPREFLSKLWAELGGPDAPALDSSVAWLTQDRSGGQAARLALARALAARPRLLLLDEPSAHLDAAGRQALMDILSRSGAFGSAIVASHDLEWLDWATKTWRPWG